MCSAQPLKNKRATLYDVAQLSGVSYQTVSRVINGSPHVAAKTRVRVLEAISTLNYQPNKAAQTLVTRRSFTLQLVTYGIGYYGPSQTLTGLERAARALGSRLIYSSLAGIETDPVQGVVESLSGHQVDGMVIIAPVSSQIYEELANVYRGLPLILIDAPSGSYLPSVVIDQHLGSQIATQHLIDLGHRQIAHISGPLFWNDARARRESWLDTMQANNLRPVGSVEGDWTAAGGYTAAQQLIGLPFTALVVANDQMALGAIRALREHGLNVPDQISVVGFDDIPEAAYFDPPLTTIRQNFEALGQQSVEYLVELINHPDTPIQQRVITPVLVERQSTRSL